MVCKYLYTKFFFGNFLTLKFVKKGPLCLNVDPCLLNPCLENEICFKIGELGEFYCLCSPDYEGYPFCRATTTESYVSHSFMLSKLRTYSIRMIINCVSFTLFFILISTSFILFKLKFFEKNKK